MRFGGAAAPFTLTDYEALGNGYFEVVRNRFGSGPPRSIHHIPAATMRVRKDRRGFLQRRGNRKVAACQSSQSVL